MSPDELKVWLNHFEYHAEHPRPIPEGLADQLDADEWRRIASSIATFQLGERSAGSSLLEAARGFARKHQVESVARITELFIREQQRHAALLRDFMEDHRIPLKAAHWTEWVFRRVRQLAGFELYLYVLITAELIGVVYYRALEAATVCQRLKVLCRAFVCDELAHIGFESHLLLSLRASRLAPARALMRLSHRAFLAGTACVVWSTHRAVLKRSGYGARSFLEQCLAQQAFYLEPTKPALASTSLP